MAASVYEGMDESAPVTSSSPPTDEQKLIHVFVSTPGNPENVMCPKCRVPPSDQELAVNQCQCGTELHPKYYRACTLKSAGLLFLVAVVGLLLFTAVSFGLYMLITIDARFTPKLEPVLEDNSTGKCVIYGVDHWAPWGPCSASCGEGKSERTWPLLGNGTGCPVTKHLRPCFNRPCCANGWTASPSASAEKKETGGDGTQWEYMCYKAGTAPQSLDEAITSCEEMAGSVARARNKRQSEILQSLGGDEQWVGLRLKYQEGDYGFVTRFYNTKMKEKRGFYCPLAKNELLVRKPENNITEKLVHTAIEDDRMVWKLIVDQNRIKKMFVCETAHIFIEKM